LIMKTTKRMQKTYEYLKEKEAYRNSCLLEATGGRGSHVWLFIQPPIYAKHARILAKRIADKLEINCEIFPKQDSIGNGYGEMDTEIWLEFHLELIKKPETGLC